MDRMSPIQPQRLFSDDDNSSIQDAINPENHTSANAGVTPEGRRVTQETTPSSMSAGYSTPPRTRATDRATCTPAHVERERRVTERRTEREAARQKIINQTRINISGPEPKYDDDHKRNDRFPPPPPSAISVAA